MSRGVRINYAERLGETFTKLTPRECYRDPSRSMWFYVCDCSCGSKELHVCANKVLSNHTRSCGCLVGETILNRPGPRYGKTPEYRAWSGMKQRCYNPNATMYKYYGARGIQVHECWLDNFKAFLAHVGPRPSKKHSLDRINPNKHYAPGNVRWATAVQQRNNVRCNTTLTLRDVTLTSAQWARVAGIPYATVKSRQKYGWPDEITLTVRSLKETRFDTITRDFINRRTDELLAIVAAGDVF